jgi:ubiquinone/menaquinone biosynthesis C-methylase UbiE
MTELHLDFIRKYELETWTRCSESYSNTWGVLTNEMLPELIKATNIMSGVKVLDIGCGPGNSSKLLSDVGTDTTGIDFSQNMIDVAKANYPNISFHQADAENIPKPDNFFDVVIANYVVHHFADPEKVFSEISRVLKPGGKFGFAVWGAPEEQSTIGAFFTAFGNHHELSELPHGPLFGVTDKETFQPFISNANFKDFELTNHKTIWNCSTIQPVIDGWWDWGNLHDFEQEKQDSIKTDFIENCNPFAHDNGYSFPHSAILGLATK